MIKLSPSQLQEEVLNAAELDESQQQSLMAEINMMSNIYAFALPGFREELNISCTFLMHVGLLSLRSITRLLNFVISYRRCISTLKNMVPIPSPISSLSSLMTPGVILLQVHLSLSAGKIKW